MNKQKTVIGKFAQNNGRALGSMGYFVLLMLVFLIGAPEAWMRPNLHQSVFVMMPTLIFLVIPLVFLVASGEIDLSFASTYALAAYVFALLVKSGVDPAIGILVGIVSGAAVGAMVGALIVVFRLSSLVASLGVLFLIRGIILVATKSRSITMMEELESHWVYSLLVGNFYGFAKAACIQNSVVRVFQDFFLQGHFWHALRALGFNFKNVTASIGNEQQSTFRINS